MLTVMIAQNKYLSMFASNLFNQITDRMNTAATGNNKGMKEEYR